MNTLPETCFAFIKSNDPGKYVVAIKRGESGFYHTTYDERDATKAKALVKQLNNNKLGVSDEHAEAMLAGSMFGWNTPAAQVPISSVPRKDIMQFEKSLNSCFGLQGNVQEAVEAYESKHDFRDYQSLVDGVAIVDAWLLWGEAQQAALGLIEVPGYEADKSIVSALYNGDGVIARIPFGDKLSDGLTWEDENGFIVTIDSIDDLTHVEYRDDESIDRLHSLTELNPEIPKMPRMTSQNLPIKELITWFSDPKVYHYLKRVEEAMPDLLIAANRFVDFAPDQEVCDRLTGCESVVIDHMLKRSYDMAVKIGAEKSFVDYFIAKNDPMAARSYTGVVMGVTPYHVVQNHGRTAIIFLKSELDKVPATGQEINIKFSNGLGKVNDLTPKVHNEVGR